MNKNKIIGRVHSLQSLGTVDGPGVRFVVFMQGCNLRCACCHNPDTWSALGGKEYTAAELADKAERYREYFGEQGGITVSGGEPLLQAGFVTELFAECKKRGINTCLDTSGCIINEEVKALLALTDRVLLDIKYTDNEKYRKYVGCELGAILRFAELLEQRGIPTTVRQVIIPTLNDTQENILSLKGLVSKYSCIDGVELLPFKKICSVKYDELGIKFPLAEFDTPTSEQMNMLREYLKN